MAQSRPNEKSAAGIANVIPIDDGEVEGTFWPLLPAGEYIATFTHHETAVVFKTKKHPGTPKVYMHFKIAKPPEYAGKHLYGAFRVTELLNQPGKNGRFKLRPRSELYMMICKLYPRDVRPDRISLRALRPVLLKVNVKTVERDYLQRPLPENLRYSVVNGFSLEAGTPHER